MHVGESLSHDGAQCLQQHDCMSRGPPTEHQTGQTVAQLELSSHISKVWGKVWELSDELQVWWSLRGYKIRRRREPLRSRSGRPSMKGNTLVVPSKVPQAEADEDGYTSL